MDRIQLYKGDISFAASIHFFWVQQKDRIVVAKKLVKN